MKKLDLILIIVCTAFFALCSFAKNEQNKSNKHKSSTDRLQQINHAFPYETRVDRTTIPGKAIHWYSDGHSVTVTPHIINGVYLTNTTDIAVIRYKKQKKDYEKAIKKDRDNIQKAVDELKHRQEKSSEEVFQLFQDAIDILEGK